LHDVVGGFAGGAGVFGVAGGAVGIFFPEDDGEFVAADAGDEVVGPGAGVQDFDQLADDGVAGCVA